MFGQKFFPYSTLQELNLDWILTKVKNILRFVPDDGAVGQILRRTKDGAEWSNETGGGGAVDSVNGQTGTVILTASDVGALPDTYTPTFPVTSVNNKTGAVVLSKTDIGLGNVANVAQYSASNPPPYPVTSVNTKTGAVVLDKTDIGLGNVANVAQYSASNPPPYPVTSVNGQTGDVSISTALPTVIVDDTYSTASSATFDKTYTVSGNGVIAVFASILSDDTSDFGTWQARIYHNGTCIMGEGTRFTTAYSYAFGASTSAPIEVSNGDTIRVYLYNTKSGRKDAYRRFLCFGGCSVS